MFSSSADGFVFSLEPFAYLGTNNEGNSTSRSVVTDGSRIFSCGELFQPQTKCTSAGHCICERGWGGPDCSEQLPDNPPAAAPIANVNSLIRTVAEPAGDNCATGGTRIDHGLDSDRSGGCA